MIQSSIDRTSFKPILLPQGKKLLAAIKDLQKKKACVGVVNEFDLQLEELFLLRHPEFRFNKNYQKELKLFLQQYVGRKTTDDCGKWFYFPWSQLVVHYLPEWEHLELRTGRNRNLITADEQKTYYESCIGVAGMSVGSHAALTIVLTGGAKYIKLADPDFISGSNLNRIRSGFSTVGLRKTIAVARQIYEMNPYSVVEVFSQGINDKNMDSFLQGKRKLRVLVEEMDNPYLKITVRVASRRLGVPIVMAADNGDGVIVDVERFDTDKNYPLLHGIVKDLDVERMRHLPPNELPQVIAKIAGASHATDRVLESVLAVGKTLYSWPQLGTAATMCGSVLSFLTRRVALSDVHIMSGRFIINPEKIFEDNDSQRKKELRAKKFRRILAV